jgi:hypothetical protein
MIRTERKEDDGIRSSAEEAEMLKPWRVLSPIRHF